MPELPFPHNFPTLRRATGSAVARLRDAALALLYPTDCRVCGQMVEAWRDGVACGSCWRALEQDWLNRVQCFKCGFPLPSLPHTLPPEERRCRRCDDCAYVWARAAGPYEGALRESVLRLKSQPQLAGRIEESLSAAFTSLPQAREIETLLPVPLHPSRLAERTFNQAEVIAVALAARSGLRVDTASLIRVKATARHRAGMGEIERAKDLAQAFQVRAPRLLAGRAVLLVDDVLTTGSTVNEIAATLLAGGARSVSVLTLARAVSLFA